MIYSLTPPHYVVLTVCGDVDALLSLVVDKRVPCGCVGIGSVGSGAFKHDWIRFFPSGFVTSGCNLGVVKVYTSPVSDTTKSNTWVPVNVLSS